jgi:gliding motility-associated-like protein
MITKTTFTVFILSLFLLVHTFGGAQVTVAFQGGEPGDTWNYTSTSASAIAIGEAQQAPNKTAGTTSLVVGGNTGGGSCFGTGTGNGPNTPRTFTFNPADISTSSDFVRTLNFHYGTRFPTCNGTGWDAGENLVFTAYHNGVAQPSVTIVTGNNNAAYNIQNNQYSWTIPACVNTFSFTLSVTTNRADELLFVDDVKITSPQLNGSAAQPSAISGPVSVCPGSAAAYSVTAVPGTTYTWSGLPAGAQFTTANGTTSGSIGIDWGTVLPGTYTISVTPAGSCSGTTGPAQTIDVTVTGAPAPLTIFGPASFCAGSTATLVSSHSAGNIWSTSETSQQITVFIEGTYTVSVNTACGTLTTSHTITASSGPDIQSIQENDVSCFGQADGSLVVTATGTSLEYSLDNVNWQQSATFANLSAGSYTVYVRGTGGCVSQVNAAISESLLTATATNDGPYCEGTPIALHGTSSAANAVYSWTGPNGYTSSAQDPSDAPGAGVYALTVSVGGCTSDPATTTVVTIPVPQAIAASSGPYCAGDPVQLNGSTDLATAVNYQWTGPNGYVSSQQNPTDAMLSGTYTLTVTNSGCLGTPASTNVVINPIPDAMASYTLPFCPGNPVELNGTTSAAGASFAWTGPNGYTSANEDPANATQAGTYTLVVTANGCASAPSSVTVVSQSPSVTVANNGPVCEGMPVQLSSSTGAATPAYSWTGPNGFTSSAANPIGINVPGVYSLTITSGNCTATASTSVVIFDNPEASFPVTSVCALNEKLFESQSTVPAPQNIVSFSWSFDDGSTGTGETILHAFTTSGDFDVSLQVTTNQGCTAMITQTVTVSERPKANFYYSPGTISSYDPTVEFTNASSFADSYVWHIDGETITEESPTYTFPETAGNYIVELIAHSAAGCSDTVRKTITSEHSVVYFVPNAFTPNGDEFNNTFKPVFTEGFDPNNYTLTVYNRWGEVIFESNDPVSGWDGTYHDALQNDGVYVWNIRFKHRENDAYEVVSGHVTLLH